ncbi:3-beta hydroxysteroid dehydrogenase/isomerase family-domain-containing protein [Hyaloraphidium curvatum]|nr:3-beta hydroxysteroid dehydrogenase/isomerase family-domain-containing protein [Hyaloraphidium curvatum]
MDRFPSELPKSMAVNVGGTKNVIEACRELSIPYLVQTSTSHVCVGQDICPILDGDESTPYTEKPVNHYSLSKVLAEKATLEGDGASLASGNGTLATASVRPTSSVFGFLDAISTESYIRVRTMFPPVRPENKIDFVHVENVALGHLLAMHALRSGTPGVRGRAFFVSNDEPMSFPEYAVLLSSHIPSFRTIDTRVIYPMYALSDVFRRFGGRLPGDMGILSLAVWKLHNFEYTFSCTRAKSVLGYKPMFSVSEALDRTMRQYNDAGMLAG